MLGLVGIDRLSGEARLTFGIPYLLDGIDVVIVVIGLFAVGETLALCGRAGGDRDGAAGRADRVWMSREEWSRSWKPWLRGTAIGFPLGALPAGGAELPTLLSYAVERRLSRHPEEFGHGAIEGVAGPGSRQQCLGRRDAGAAADARPADVGHGGGDAGGVSAVRPAARTAALPARAALVWALIASLYIGNVMLLVLNLPLVRLWVKLLTIPRPQLYAGILVLATLGAYSVHRSAGDLVLLAAIGVLGFALRQAGHVRSRR